MDSSPEVGKGGSGATFAGLVSGRPGGWLVSLAVTLFAGALRFWQLGRPPLLVADEGYYAPWAWSLIHHGFVTWHTPDAAQLINAGITVGIMNDQPAFPAHPPTGMWLIGAGESIFGMTPFGWRFSSAVAGTLLVLVVIRLLLRLTGSLFLAAAGGLLLALDGLELVMSRLGMLDIFLTLFLLVGVSALVADRDWLRRRLVARAGPQRASVASGAWLWWRPWRLVAGLSFGLAVSTKWSALYVIAVFGVVAVLWDLGARRRLGTRRVRLRAVLSDGVVAFAYLVVVAAVVYVVSWSPWLFHAHETAPSLAFPFYGGSSWGNWVNSPPQGIWDNVAYAFRALWHYHQDMFRFHTVTLGGKPGPGTSPAWGWPLLLGPFLEPKFTSMSALQPGCTWSDGGTCYVGLVGLGTPILWWLGALAILDGAYLMVAKRDWRITVPMLGFLAGWVPWLVYGDRPIYSYYALVMIPFTVIVLVLVLQRWIPPGGRAAGRLTRGHVLVLVVIALVAANLAWEWPVLTEQPVSRQDYLQRVPFPTWRLGEGDTGSISIPMSGSSSPGATSLGH